MSRRSNVLLVGSNNFKTCPNKFWQTELQRGLTAIEILTTFEIVVTYPHAKRVLTCHHGKRLRAFVTPTKRRLYGCHYYQSEKRYCFDYCDAVFIKDKIGLTRVHATWFSDSDLRWLKVNQKSVGITVSNFAAFEEWPTEAKVRFEQPPESSGDEKSDDLQTGMSQVTIVDGN